jgi:LytS/YehU family sensor histidine kinase
MRINNKNLLEIRWLQEVLIFFILFILITLNAWHTVTSLGDVGKAVTYFLILYVQVQLHRFILLPNLINKGKPLVYFICTGLLILFFSAALYASDFYWINNREQTVSITNLNIYFYHVGTCSLGLIAMLAPFLVSSYYLQQKRQSAIEISMNRMELKSLTAQLNPHFLFNTFNNLYGISLNDPSRVPDIILQVSKLMRYQLNINNKDLVALDDELGFIEGYIELEEERVGQRCTIKYEYDTDAPGEEYLIAPLLLISFIENAFKHGANNIADSFVHINIYVKEAVFNMQVINSLPYAVNRDNSMGIGLKNTIQRLNILYTDKYKLVTEPGLEKYSVHLMLPLILKKNAG